MVKQDEFGRTKLDDIREQAPEWLEKANLYHGMVPDTRVGSTFGHEFTGIADLGKPNRP